jgi:hypothetical protein
MMSVTTYIIIWYTYYTAYQNFLDGWRKNKDYSLQEYIIAILKIALIIFPLFFYFSVLHLGG